MFKQQLSASLIVINTLAGLSIATTAFAATPPVKPGCPKGSVPAPNPKLGCISNTIKPKQPPQINGTMKKSPASRKVKFPPEIPQDFKLNLCELGVVDPIDCPENNPIPTPRN